MALEWLEERGQKILYVDYRGQSEPQMLEQLERVVVTLRNAGGTPFIVDITNGAVGSKFMARAKEVGPELERLAPKQAIVGVDGIKAILLKAYNAVVGGRMRPFPSVADAVAYLAS
jgi:hypothetical protein